LIILLLLKLFGKSFSAGIIIMLCAMPGSVIFGAVLGIYRQVKYKREHNIIFSAIIVSAMSVLFWLLDSNHLIWAAYHSGAFIGTCAIIAVLQRLLLTKSEQENDCKK
jgi:hypothetical protein